MAVPDTTGWRINLIYLQQALIQFCFKDVAVFPDVNIDVDNFDQFIRGIIDIDEEEPLVPVVQAASFPNRIQSARATGIIPQ